MSRGTKFDTGKPRWDLLTWRELEDVVRVFALGARKYQDNNWQEILREGGSDRYFAAAMRHIVAWRIGSDRKDEESGLSHLAHAVCCLLFLMWGENNLIQDKEVCGGASDK